MWIFTKYGFYSVVCARKGKGGHGQPVDPDRVMIRARDENHLKALQKRFPLELGSLEIFQTPGTDYACRLFASKSVWSGILAELAAETDYDNFKSEVARHLGVTGQQYGHALHDVWSVMYKYQKRDS